MKKFILYILLIINLPACEKEVLIEPGTGYESWTTASHSSYAEPDYSIVFDDSKVHRIDIRIDEAYWQAMQDNLEALYANQQQNLPPPPRKAGTEITDENPVYVPCQVYYNDLQWYNVGIRYKGNSSLRSAYQQGNKKLPFRLEFNHFEDEDPLIWGQSFYGFQQLSFSNGFKDNSLIREKITSELFREFGIPAAHTAFYRVYVDYGEGPVYFGLYTVVEVVFDTMISDQFSGNGEGNCFKPDGTGAHLNTTTVIGDATMANKTHEGVYTEATNLISALTDPVRLTQAGMWRNMIEQVMDMDQYLRYLAANTTIANWDTYGIMAHNYYLYANPEDGKLNWIPWDNNEALNTSGSQPALYFDFSNMQDDAPTATDCTWPMIQYIYDDPVYRNQYQQYIDEFVQTVFTVNNVHAKINTSAEMIGEYVTGQDGEIPGYTFLNTDADWILGIDGLKAYIQTRIDEAALYTP